MEIELFSAMLEEYKNVFGLNNWKIVVRQSPLDEKYHNAMTIADPRYQHATMTVYPRLLNSGSENYEEVIIHELIHIVFAMYDYFADNLGKEGTDDLFFIARESGVSAMTSVIMRMLKGGRNGEKTN